jgi:hypothetical protein
VVSLARESKSSIARVQAIKQLIAMEDDPKVGPLRTGFENLDSLYDDELAARRKAS